MTISIVKDIVIDYAVHRIVEKIVVDYDAHPKLSHYPSVITRCGIVIMDDNHDDHMVIIITPS